MMRYKVLTNAFIFAKIFKEVKKMYIKKSNNYREVEKLAREGADVIIIETPTYTYKNEKSANEFGQMILAAPLYAYTHPNPKSLLYEYEIFIPQKELAKRIKRTFGWTSICKPLGIIEYLYKLGYRIWEKVRRGFHLGGPFWCIPICKNLYCLNLLSEKGEVERKLANLSTSAK